MILSVIKIAKNISTCGMKRQRRMAWKRMFLITPSLIKIIPVITTAKSLSPKTMKPDLIEK
jgi:hypothetical protein